MFSSLHSRLLRSYVVVICVCLVLVRVTLILIDRAVQERLLTGRLSTQILLVAPRVQALLVQGQVPARLTNTLARSVARQGMRLLLVDQHGWILGGAAGHWAGQRVAADELLRPGSGERGRGRPSGPNGSSLMYAAALVGRTESGEHIGAIAVSAPPPPVTGLVGDLGEGLLMAGDEVARRRVAEVIYEEGSRMVRMVDQLGDLARIDAGEMTLIPSLIDLAALVGGVVTTIATVALSWTLLLTVRVMPRWLAMVTVG